MAFRFRKSMKIAPGLKVNLTHRGMSARVGPKGAGYTVNSKGAHTASAGIAGTGISYSKKVKSARKGDDASHLGTYDADASSGSEVRRSSLGKNLVAILLALIGIVFLISVLG